MKALIYILAIILMAAGIAVGLVSFFSPGEVVLGINLGLAATLFSGGVVTLALAGVMTAVSDLGRRLNKLAKAASAEIGGGREAGAPAAERIAKVVAGSAGLAAAAEAAEAAGEKATQEPTEAVEDTPAAASEGRREIFVSPRQAAGEEAQATEAAGAEETAAASEVGAGEGEAEAEKAAPAGKTEAGAEAEEAVVEPVEEAVEEAGEDVDVEGLYVVEERIIRGRQARMLSDSTVEAETDEGWMRFENLEHLEEYMEAMSHAR